MKNDTPLKKLIRAVVHDDTKDGCGFSRIWLTTPGDPFFPACVRHDRAYEVDSPEQASGMRRKDVDLRFYGEMLEIAASDRKLRLRAYFYYSIVRTVGWAYWEGE